MSVQVVEICLISSILILCSVKLTIVAFHLRIVVLFTDAYSTPAHSLYCDNDSLMLRLPKVSKGVILIFIGPRILAKTLSLLVVSDCAECSKTC